VAALIVAGALAATYALLLFGYGSLHGPGEGREVELDWPADLGPEGAAARLGAAGLIGSPSLFAWYLRITHGANEFRPGPHLLTDDLSPSEIVARMRPHTGVVDRLRLGPKVRVTLPEGFNRFDIAKRMQAQRICAARSFLAATAEADLLGELKLKGDSAEGFLFPSTYEFPADSDPHDVVRRLVNEFDKRFTKLRDLHPGGLESLATSLGWGTLEVVTLASMIEKEARADEERPIIASVFFNRLRDPSFSPRRLQSDPTSAYGCLAIPERIPSCRTYAGRVTPEMNADEANPYTTYRHEGLPPGPIANPGEKSMDAVLAPAESHYFYFVARGEGHHTFSETLAQHNEAIRHTARATP
jgi:UPF0755 protein